MTLNGKKISADIDADMLLIDFVRDHGCYSVKRGCETSNCGLCTVFLDEKPVLSCSVLAARADGRTVHNTGRPPGRGGRIRCVYRRPGSGTMRILQPGDLS